MAENLSSTKQYETYPGKTLGNYYVERLIEYLETGPLFMARQATLPAKQRYHLRFLALPAGLTAEERLLYLGHFQREASLVATLQHSFLIPLSDYGIFESSPYVVSPDPASISFQSTVANNGPVEGRLVSRSLDALASALEYIHQQGVFHLNLNPRNVFLRSDGQALISETGLLRMLAPQLPAPPRPALELENGSPLLRDRQGRALYGLNIASAPAPELLLGQPPEEASEVYALGALLYYLLTGHRALRAKTLAELAQQHLNAPVPPLSAWRQGWPAELERLLSSAMAKNPAQRPGSPGALANAYASIVAPNQGERKAFAMPAAPPPGVVRPTAAAAAAPAPASTALSRRRALTLLATGGGVAATAGVTIWLIKTNSANSSLASTNPNSVAQHPTTGTQAQGTSTSSNAPGHSGKVLAKTTDLPTNSAKTFPIANSNNPGILIHLQNNKFVAFNTTCTHAGCAVAYNQGSHLLECPCHGATFDPARGAAVTGGPAPTPLASLPITVNSDGTITTPA
ncbi:MAG TPA: Rieske 2Fe-2S domain-containing protein [Ktedonobacteraceae bacterium]